MNYFLECVWLSQAMAQGSYLWFTTIRNLCLLNSISEILSLNKYIFPALFFMFYLSIVLVKFSGNAFPFT